MVTILAHRGASAVCRENTLEAFAAARAQGADGVELDLRRSSDGALVVHHDPVVVPAATLPGWVPHLAAALDACQGMVVNIEIKNLPGQPDYDPDDAAAAGLVALLDERGGRDQVVVSSFNLATVDRVRVLDPGIPTGWLTAAGYDQLGALYTAAQRGHGALHPEDPAVTPELMAAAREADVDVTTWTVDDPERMRRLAEIEVDALITNVPDVAVAVLRPQGM